MSTIEKALGLLEHFSVNSPEIGLSEFKRRTALDKGTLHRYLTSLRNCGFLEQNRTTRAYRLGPAFIRLSTVREKTVPLAKLAAAEVEKVASELHELVHAALPQSNGMSALYASDGGYAGTRVGFDEAEILPFHATSSGIAMLAFGPAELEEAGLAGKLQKFTSQTPVTHDETRALVAKTKESGFAITNESFEDDVCSVAVPFFDHSELAIGTIAIATPAARMTREMQALAKEALVRASTELSRNLGGRVPDILARKWAGAG